MTPKQTSPKLPNDYNEILQCAVAVIERSRNKIALHAANAASNSYYEIGRLLYEKKLDSKYGDAVVKRLSTDLKDRFPKMGLSIRNLWNMRSFYVRFRNSEEKVQRSVALLPWTSTLLIIREDLSDKDVLFYAQETINKCWNRDLLLNAIKMKMHEKALPSADNNFDETLPSATAQYANEIFRDSYNLGFLGITEPMAELDLERRLVDKIKHLLLEFGKWFTYVGNQYELEYNGRTSRIDMLFYHRGLRCLVAIDLKIGEFQPEYAGKMNYYLSLLDKLEKRDDENPSIGIILCAEKDHVQVELALEGIGKPIGVVDYQLIIPKEELQKAIADEIRAFEKGIDEQRI